jgi:hypothetical protein
MNNAPSYLWSFENGNATTGRLLLEVSSCVVNAFKRGKVKHNRKSARKLVGKWE